MPCAVVYLAQTLSIAAMAVAAQVDAPPALVAVAAAVPIASITFIRPCMSVTVPSLAVSPAQLVGANYAMGNADSVGALLGPLLAGALLRLHGPEAVLVRGDRGRCGLRAAHAPTTRCRRVGMGPHDRAPSLAAPHSGALRRSAGSSTLLVVLGAEHALVGALDLLCVNLALGLLGLSAAGPGYLNAAFGAGALVGGVASFVLVARRRLAPTMLATLALVAVALVALFAHVTLVATIVVLVVLGGCRAALHISGRVLLQRSVPPEVVASAFSVAEIVAGVGAMSGAVLVQVLIATSGVRAALVALVVLFLAVTVVSVRGLREADAHADVPLVEYRLLRQVPLLAPLPPAVLEQVARRCLRRSYAAGSPVVCQGDRGDDYHVIVEGRVRVLIDGEFVRMMSRGQGFGEIALLADLARTATVEAIDDTTTLSIGRADFLSAVTGSPAASSAAWAVARAWHPPIAGEGR